MAGPSARPCAEFDAAGKPVDPRRFRIIVRNLPGLVPVGETSPASAADAATPCTRSGSCSSSTGTSPGGYARRTRHRETRDARLLDGHGSVQLTGPDNRMPGRVTGHAIPSAASPAPQALSGPAPSPPVPGLTHTRRSPWTTSRTPCSSWCAA